MIPSVRTFFLVSLIALALLAAGAGFTLRAPLERAFVLWSAGRSTGLAIDADRVSPIDGGYEFTNVTAHTPGGAVSVEAARATVLLSGHYARIALDGARFVFDPDRYRGDELERTRAALERFGAPDAAFTLEVDGATLTIVTGVVPVPLLAFDRLSGSLDGPSTLLGYFVRMQLRDGGRSYPIASHSEASADGSLSSAWTAPVRFCRCCRAGTCGCSAGSCVMLPSMTARRSTRPRSSTTSALRSAITSSRTCTARSFSIAAARARVGSRGCSTPCRSMRRAKSTIWPRTSRGCATVRAICASSRG
jgi:hypothetical protein